MHVFSDGPQAFAWAFPSEDHRAIFAAVDALGVGHFERGVLQKELAVVLRKQLPNATLRSAALAMGRSPRTLQRELLAHSITFREVLEEARLVHARHLLSETDSKIEAIARAVGYSSSSGLSRAFRDAYDTTPLAWRQVSRKSE